MKRLTQLSFATLLPFGLCAGVESVTTTARLDATIDG